MTIRFFSLDVFKLGVRWKLLQNAAADVVPFCTLGVHPRARANHVS